MRKINHKISIKAPCHEVLINEQIVDGDDITGQTHGSKDVQNLTRLTKRNSNKVWVILEHECKRSHNVKIISKVYSTSVPMRSRKETINISATDSVFIDSRFTKGDNFMLDVGKV